MEKKNIGMKVAIVILSILVLGLGSFIVYEHVLVNDVENNNINNGIENTSKPDKEISSKDYSKEDLKKIIDDQLWILFNFNYYKNEKSFIKIKDISNDEKLLLALVLLEDKYLINSDDVDATFVGFSSDELEKAFNDSVISNLGIKHNSFDIYNITEDDDWYNREESLTFYSKSFLKYHMPVANKIKNFNSDDNQYIISMNYLFPDDMLGTQYYHGSITDALNEKNQIVKAYDENDDDGEYIDAQKYLDDNYSKIKDKLATYKYVFEVKDGKLILTDFSIK